jgi:lipoprotein-anchoring transpeptidase ErfK/SrfK
MRRTIAGFVLITLGTLYGSARPGAVRTAGNNQNGNAILREQVHLSRAGFSVGEIDGAAGESFHHAVSGFQESRGLPQTGKMDAATLKELGEDATPVLVKYTITQQDVAGPFEKIPADMMEKAKLKRLGYESVQEALGEKFHTNPRLLRKLNPGKIMDRAGVEIMVPNVIKEPPGKAASVTVSKSKSVVRALDANGKVIAQYPATIGSEHDPLPLGNWVVTTVLKTPPFYYDPSLFWNAEAGDEKAKIAPGPNNPVGLIWIGLSKPHYGIHGTPEPSTVGHAQSHGCIRLTNWDAIELAGMVGPKTPVLLTE